jgi:ketosteroid isomerase-like protein
MAETVKEFFARYEKANAESDVAGIAALYANVFLFCGPAGVRSVNRDDFLKVIPRRKEHFATMGLIESRVNEVQEAAVDAKYLLARTSWTMTLKISDERKELHTSATYILERSGEAMAIVVQIDHQDLATKLAELRRSD